MTSEGFVAVRFKGQVELMKESDAEDFLKKHKRASIYQKPVPAKKADTSDGKPKKKKKS